MIASDTMTRIHRWLILKIAIYFPEDTESLNLPPAQLLESHKRPEQ